MNQGSLHDFSFCFYSYRFFLVSLLFKTIMYQFLSFIYLLLYNFIKNSNFLFASKESIKFAINSILLSVRADKNYLCQIPSS